MRTHKPTPDHILEIGYAYWKSKTLLSAVELDLFTVLAQGPLDCDQLIARLGLAGRQARDFFDALVSLELLVRDIAGHYANTPETEAYLSRGSSTYIGGALALQNASGYQSWGALTAALRSGAPKNAALNDGFEALCADQTALETFLSGMRGGVILPARALANKYPWERCRTVADIGAGQGCCLTEIAHAHPHITGWGFDLAPIASLFEKYINAQGLSNRLWFRSGDFFSDTLPQADALIMGRVLHNWDSATKQMLLRKAYAALPAKGTLIIYETLIDDQRCRNSHALLQSLNMLVMTQSGYDYTAADCFDWLKAVGFRDMYVEPLASHHSMIVSTK
jgi:SAM-dependent methyltransferase